MKKLLAGLILFVLASCAGGPASDFDREFFTDQIISRTLAKAKTAEQANRQAEVFLQLADISEVAISSTNTGKAMQIAIAVWASERNLVPEDQKLVAYLVRKMLPSDVDLQLPLTTEHKRVIAVYVAAIRTSVDSWRQSQ